MKKLIYLLITITLCVSLRYNINSLSNTVPELDAVYRFIGDMNYNETDYTIDSYTRLSDFSENIYILYNLSPMGYLIMHESTKIVTEASFESLNPYSKIYNLNNENLYYIGPGNYFEIYNSKLFSSKGKEFDFNSSYIKISDDYNNKIIEYKKNLHVSNNHRRGLNYSSTTDNSWTLIQHHEYFEKLYTSQFPENINGTCGYVALSILLGYYDTFYSDLIIPNGYVYYQNGWLNLTEYGSVYLSSNDNNMTLENWTKMPGTTQNLHDILLGYGHYDFSNSYGTPIYTDGMVNTLNDYFNHYVYTIQDEIDIVSKKTSVIYNIMNYVDDGYPVLTSLAMYATDFNGIELRFAHNVIVYGYKETMTIPYLKAHMGWGDDSTQMIILGIGFDGMIALEYNGEHKHSRNVRVYSTNPNIYLYGYYVCGCGDVTRPSFC